jgi:hypothetical protein
VALLLKIYDDLKPRPLTEEEQLRESAPRLVQVRVVLGFVSAARC